jgi:hypothetical protein
MCHLCTGRQADYVPDPWTEARKAAVLAQLWEAERAMRSARPPVNRMQAVFAGSTATTSTWRCER